MLTFDDYNMSPDPEQTASIYESGFRGVLRDTFARQATRRPPGRNSLLARGLHRQPKC